MPDGWSWVTIPSIHETAHLAWLSFLGHKGEIAGLGAPVASIGGAGTFDGIFLTGILAVLLA